MNKKPTRRRFLANTALAGVGLTAAGAQAGSEKPALLGGKPVRTEPFPSWPVFDDKEEKELVNHDRVLAFDDKSDPVLVVNEALQIVQGKECFERLIVGVDPGEVLGVAVLGDGMEDGRVAGMTDAQFHGRKAGER